MITKMKKLSFLIYSKEYEQFLEQLRALGVVHVIRKEQGAVQDSALQEDINLLARYKSALKVLEGHKGDGSFCALETGSPFDEFVKRAQKEPSLLCPSRVMERFDILEADKVVLDQTMQILSRDRAQLLPWGDFEPQSVERLAKAGYKIRFYTCPLRAFKDEWTDKYGVVEILRDKQKVNFITLTHTDDPVDIDAEQVQLPSMSLSL